jgi:uncharacterized protein
VAFSGGVDSTFLLRVCADELGEKVVAVTATSETFPKRELEEAKRLARQIGVEHIIIESEELDAPGFSDNPTNRCFICKNELFSKIWLIARQRGISNVFDGSNADDAGDFRPGRQAARRLGVRSPLEEAGLGKEDIRTLSRWMGLPTWDKPPFACLSSRFPYHTKITREALRKVDRAEEFLTRLGFRTLRVRHHDSLVRIELGAKEMRRIWEDGMFEQVVAFMKSLGYAYVTLDLEGYRSGSMNETLPTEKKAKGTDQPF